MKGDNGQVINVKFLAEEAFAIEELAHQRFTAGEVGIGLHPPGALHFEAAFGGALLDAGIRMAGASDAPIESPDVLHAIQCCVTREGFEPQQGITTLEALRMYTFDAAYAQCEESVKGSISIGKRADMVILSRNPIAVPPEEIQHIKVVKTIVAGKAIYESA